MSKVTFAAVWQGYPHEGEQSHPPPEGPPPHTKHRNTNRGIHRTKTQNTPFDDGPAPDVRDAPRWKVRCHTHRDRFGHGPSGVHSLGTKPAQRRDTRAGAHKSRAARPKTHGCAGRVWRTPNTPGHHAQFHMHNDTSYKARRSVDISKSTLGPWF